MDFGAWVALGIAVVTIALAWLNLHSQKRANLLGMKDAEISTLRGENEKLQRKAERLEGERNSLERKYVDLLERRQKSD